MHYSGNTRSHALYEENEKVGKKLLVQKFSIAFLLERVKSVVYKPPGFCPSLMGNMQILSLKTEEHISDFERRCAVLPNKASGIAKIVFWIL